MTKHCHYNAPRLFVDSDLKNGAAIVCSGEQANYLLNVLRLADGAQVLLFNGRDGEWRAQTARRGGREAALEIVEQIRPQQEGPDLHYLFAPLKHARLDYMVQKATEMGVARLAPVFTQRTNVARVNLDRMHANAIEAAEQCGVLRVPEVAEPAKLEAVLAGWNPARRLIFCDEAASVADPIGALGTVKPGPLAVLIGPEGGFAPGERDVLLRLPFVLPIALGPRIMRADTAAVAALALLNSVLGDWR